MSMSISKIQEKVYNEAIIVERIDRERICNDQMNTGVVAALIGGFAYESLHNGVGEGTALDQLIYMFSLIAVHACTCSCLCSVFLYQKANSCHDAQLTDWVKSNSILFQIPLIKFTGGCVIYLVSVILLTYKHLEGHGTSSTLALIVGIMSVSMVFATVGYLKKTSPEDNWNCAEDSDGQVKPDNE